MLQKVQNYLAMKVLGDSRRLAILQLLMEKPATLSLLGKDLDISPARVRHHLVQLEKAGFVELVCTREVRGFTEKYYQATAQAYWINLTLMPNPSERGTVVVFGSHDPALEMLTQHMNADPATPNMLALPVGSLDGLIALRQGFCQLTGCHLFDPVENEYNISYVRHLFPGQPMHVVTLAFREQGLLVAPGNPCQIRGLEDLGREDLVFINRKRGSGTRLWLDHQLRSLGLESDQIRGYEREVHTHSLVAEAVFNGEANLGLAVLAAACKLNLDFIPLFVERFDLVIPENHYRNTLLLPVMEYLHTAQFRTTVQSLAGYNAQETGNEVQVLEPG